MEKLKARQQLCYVDVGGTFTDSFIVAEDGSFVAAKAPSTPGDIKEGFFDSIEVATRELGLKMDELFSQLRILGYGATIVINALLTGSGIQPGLIITKGFKDIFLMERGKQAWTELGRIERMHAVTHRHLKPLVPKRFIREVTERIDCLGKELIPLYEHEARRAAKELLDKGVEAIVIGFLWSFLNDSHERRVGDIAKEIIKEQGKEMPVYLSVDVNPVMKELPRMNATVIEASTAPILMDALEQVENELTNFGFKGTLQIMQSSGGLVPLKYTKAVDTLESGPVGGLVGGRFIGELYGFDSIITTDVGGTSFDVGLITGGMINVSREPICARRILRLPMAEVTSMGAGGGTIARIDPLTGRLEVGPESAGAVPGPVCYAMGGTQPTVTDADLILGYINPDYFIGGKLKLNKKKAEEAIRKEITDPLGLDVIEAAGGIKEIIDTRMRDTLEGLITARGFELSDYVLLAFGGAGPTHVAGYTKGLPLKATVMFPYSSVFSAFGASSADFEHHYTHATNLVIPPSPSGEVKLSVGKRINEVWKDLEVGAFKQMEEEGFSKEKVKLRHLAMMRYGRQLNDLIVTSPVPRINTPQDWDKLIEAFERLYERIYTTSAKFPEAGFDIVEIGLVSSVEKIKPRLRKRELTSEAPPEASMKGSREAYFDGEMVPTDIYEMDELKPGNIISGPAVIEHPTTTYVIPPGRLMEIDEYSTLWLK